MSKGRKRGGRKRFLAHARLVAEKRGPPKGLSDILREEAELETFADEHARLALPALLRSPPRTELPPLFVIRDGRTLSEIEKPRVTSDVTITTRIRIVPSPTVEPYVPEPILGVVLPQNTAYTPTDLSALAIQSESTPSQDSSGRPRTPEIRFPSEDENELEIEYEHLVPPGPRHVKRPRNTA